MTHLVPAVDRALRILRVFKNGHTEHGAADLSRLLNLNKSTVHDILHTLAHHGLLERNPATHKYRLGPGLLALSDLARQRRDVREQARPVLQELTSETGSTSLLGMFEDDAIIIVDKAEPSSDLKMTASVGQRLPFCAGCFGRALLAWMDEATVDRLLASPGLRKFTRASIINPRAYRSSLAEVRRRGYAVDDEEEYLPGVWAASAPIRDTGGVVAALTVVDFTSRMTAKRKKAAVRALLRAAQRISQRLGVSGGG
jgi:IclR family acetate operon transcriptional repressor